MDATNQTLLEELEELSDLMAYMVGDGGIAGVLTQLKRLNEVGENMLSTKRALTDQMTQIGDVLESMATKMQQQDDAFEQRWYFIQREPDTGRILHILPTSGASFRRAAQCVEGWHIEGMNVPRQRTGHPDQWSVYIADKTAATEFVGSFGHWNLAADVCQATWHQAHPEGGETPEWIKTRPHSGLPLPVRIPSHAIGRIVSLLIVPPHPETGVTVFHM